MEFQAVRGIGGPGTGKTRMITEVAEKALQRPEVAGDPFRIGFSSFTRAARTEAAERMGAAVDVSPYTLMNEGHYKTAHAAAYRAIGAQKGDIIGNSKEDDQWLCEAMDCEISYSFDDDEGGSKFAGDPVASKSLNLWNLARSLVVPLKSVVMADQSEDAIAYVDAKKRVDRYESAKAAEGRMDFTDLLARFVGLRFTSEGPIEAVPQGDVPHTVVGWIFDEAQDASRLLDMACRRLVEGDACKWVWLVGDPFQVLYSWSGASSEHFMGWEVVREKTMPKSWRCGRAILDFGEQCIRRLRSGYWDRGIAPADHHGSVTEELYYADALEQLDPRKDSMVLARTNYQAAKLSRYLDEIGIPYRRIKGASGPSKKARGLAGLWALQHGDGIDGESFSAVIDCLPAKGLGGVTWLTRGSKKRWREQLSEVYDRVYFEDLPALGATPELINAVQSGQWSGLPDGGSNWVRAARRFGADAVCNPKIRLGTIHSAKGMEASKVIMLSSLGRKIWVGANEIDERWNEECRIAYVAATRAKHELVIAHDPSEKFRMELPL